MTSLRNGCVAALVSLIPIAAEATTTLIDFEDQTEFRLITNQYQSQGVVFSSDGDPFSPPFVNVTDTNNFLGDNGRFTTGTFNIRADFTAPVSDVRVDVHSTGGTSVIATLFDAMNNVLTTQTTRATTFGDYVSLNLGGTDVAYAIFVTPEPTRRAVIIDNLQFSTAAPVPLPAAGFMLLAGLGGMRLMRRRQKRES
ncbi:MAG: VPLPA-CTERM sorting domain-containing protein [Pseudomonadota bacterium]